MQGSWIPAMLLALGVCCAAAAAVQDSKGEDQPMSTPNAALQYYQGIVQLMEYVQILNREQSAERYKILEDGHRANLDETAAEVVGGCERALSYLHRGARMTYCDWGLPLEEEGLNTLMLHLWEAKLLSRAACLRARLHFKENNPTAAVDDLVAVLALSRHVANEGRDGHMPLLVEGEIELRAVDVAACHLPQLDLATAQRLADCLERLPDLQPLENLVRTDAKLWIDWHVAYAEEAIETGQWDENWLTTRLCFREDGDIRMLKDAAGGTPEGLLRLANASRKYFEEAATLIALPKEQYRTQWAALEKRAKAENAAFAVSLLPSISCLRDLHDRNRARRAMFKAAVEVIHGEGPKVLEEVPDPFGTGPFEYHALPDGFELRYQITDYAREPVVLKVGVGESI